MIGKNVVIVAHKFLTQPDDDLVTYLNLKRTPNVLHIMHSFDDASDRRSYYRWYKNGKLYKEKQSTDFKLLSAPLIYLKEMVFTVRWLISLRITWDLYIGMDGLCTFFGLKLRMIGSVRKVVFWAIDFVPENRFESKLKNKIYRLVNSSGYKKADEMWDLSPRMAKARENLLGFKAQWHKKHRVVPYGVWTERIKKYPYSDCEKSTAVFMGHLVEKQGVQLVIEGIPKILKRIPEFKLKVIGTGRYKSELEDLAERLGVAGNCIFTGKIDDHRQLEDEIAKSCIAIAPYIKELDTWTYYADPGKVKTYLASGVPVVITDLPWNAREIDKYKCGIVVRDNVSSVAKGIIKLMDPSINQDYRDRAIKYSRRFDYNTIFENLKL